MLLSLTLILFAGAVSADQSTIYVNNNTGNDDWDGQSAVFNATSGSGPKLTIKNATGTVLNEGTVNIADGTYTGANNRNILIDRNMTINGQSKAGTIIDAQGQDGIFTVNKGNNVIFNNLTFKNGNKTFGGAIYNYGNITVQNSLFTGNVANDWYGGAIYNNIGNCTVTGSTFTGNKGRYGGAISCSGGNLILDKCTFNSNNATTSSGGAIDSFNGNNLTITTCTFTGNTANGSGGAINNENAGIITGCTFISNNATNGGAIITYINCTVTGSTFTGNNASNGGAIYNSAYIGGNNVTLIGNNFYSNTATSNGGVIYNNGNCTAYFNRFYANNAVNGTAVYCYNGTMNMEKNWWGDNLDPMTKNNRILVKNGTVDANPWLLLTVTANPNTVKEGGKSTITAHVYMDSDGVDHSSQWVQFFKEAQVKFTTNLGQIGSKQITVLLNYGKATATLTANEGVGVYTVNTTLDDQTLSTNINVTGEPEVNEVNAASNTIGMQETGIPVNYLILAVLMVIGGIFVPRRK